jgi:carbamoyl-phosphate synthase large subunit
LRVTSRGLGDVYKRQELGPEMNSTGESILFIKDLKDPAFRELYKQKSMYLSY